MSINPNDPVVDMLRGIVTQYEHRLGECAQRIDELTEALETVMQGTAQAILSIQKRLAELEAKGSNGNAPSILSE